MREDGAFSVPAALALGGIDLGYWLKARWPDHIGILEALAVEIHEQRKQERADLAVKIANEVIEGLDRSMKA